MTSPSEPLTPAAVGATPLAPLRPRTRRAGGLLPGFGLSLGVTLLYLGIVILVPLSTLAIRSFDLHAADLQRVLLSSRTLAAFRLSFLGALVAAIVNVVFGVIVAWVLERVPFPGRRLVDGLVDLPFALPTAVAGIALASVYAPNGWLGQWLEPHGVKVAFSPLGVVVALVFVGLPFVVRTVQPVLRDLDVELEEAAATLGAGRLRTLRQVVLPELRGAVLTGFVLALARGLGEYGSVIFIAGNLPGKSEIAPLLIMIQLEQYDYPAATAIALAFLLLAFALLLVLNRLAPGLGRGVRSGGGA